MRLLEVGSRGKAPSPPKKKSQVHVLSSTFFNLNEWSITAREGEVNEANECCCVHVLYCCQFLLRLYFHLFLFFFFSSARKAC